MANPANRLKKYFALEMAKKTCKELDSYRTFAENEFTIESDKHLRSSFLSPSDNIEKLKRFPMTTKRQVFVLPTKYRNIDSQPSLQMGNRSNAEMNKHLVLPLHDKSSNHNDQSQMYLNTARFSPRPSYQKLGLP